MEKTYLLCNSLAVFMLLSSIEASFCDEAALLAFKSHITLDPGSIITDSWSTGSTYCNWVGVSCGPGHRRVIALNLPNMGLTGTIAPQLGNLSFLTIFNISYNSFHGPIPKEMGHLRRLKVIDLQHNQLTGGIPSSLGALSNLRSLSLSFNNFTGTIPAALLDDISNHFLGNIPKDIEHKNKGSAGNSESASDILQGSEGRRSMTSMGEQDLGSRKYREPTLPSHSSNPRHADPNTSPGEPHI